MTAMSTRRVSLVGAALAGVVGCGGPPEPETYFDHFIRPALISSCNNVSACHAADPDDPFGRAAGNLDFTSFENISKRRDLLVSYGAYGYPGLLIKATATPVVTGDDANALPLTYNDFTYDLEVAHNGGGVLRIGEPAFDLLLRWTDNGATENGLEPPTPPQQSDTPCSTSIPPEFGQPQIDAAMAEPGFAGYRDTVEPIFERKGCAAGICHGAPQADFYITCGDTPEQVAYNYTQAHAFVGDPPEASQLLIVPLAARNGGIGHSGGDQFTGMADPDYVAIRDWAEVAQPIVFGANDPGQTFFMRHVQPIFLLRGCSFMNCHSPAATNDFKLRSGSLGFFSSLALQRNYDLLTKEFMALEYPDVRRSRVVSKNITPAAGGIRHRGGPVLEKAGFPAATFQCGSMFPFDPATWTPMNDTFMPESPVCTIQAWVDIERRTRIMGNEVDPLNPGNQVPIVYVNRPGGGPGATHLEFDAFQQNSDLMITTSTLGAQGQLGAAGAGTSLLGGCAGTTPATADVRAPEVHPDGVQIVFAMRRNAAEGLQIWKVSSDGSNCVQLTNTPQSQNGINIHNFDPFVAPDGTIVFASTRGGPGGPTRSRSPGFQPQSDIWRMGLDGSNPEQVTFLTNSEIGPAMMREGRITMTTEKVFVDPQAYQGTGVFHQLSGRRINWDRTDYHPLLAQRSRSPYADPTGDLNMMLPTVDYAQATDIRERANGDFLIILSDVGANGGGGALAVFNRSAGTFETGRFNMDQNQGDPSFLESVLIADPGMEQGRLASTSAYRGTYGLPDGQILTSYATLGGNLDSANAINWDIVSVAIDLTTKQATRTTILGGAGAQMDAVLAVKRPPGPLFFNRRQLVFGGRQDAALASSMTAHVHFPDAPMVFTLLTGNLRRGRPIDAFRGATHLAFYREEPQTGTTANNGTIFQNRSFLGRVPLMGDGSTRAQLPAGEGVIMQLERDGTVLVSMGEEHQLGPGEVISLGIKEELFDAACGGCHGSITGSELDTATRPDVLTGASQSMSETMTPIQPN
jgi:hypothetical protein